MTMNISVRLTGLIFFCLCLFLPLSTSAEVLWEGDVGAGLFPVETVEVIQGEVLSVTADPADEWRVFGDDFSTVHMQWSNADGLDPLYGMAYDGIQIGSLVGKIGDTGDWFFIGTDFTREMSASGMLYLLCWDDPDWYYDNEEYITVTVSQPVFDPADLDRDGDVDGADLAEYAADTAVLSLTDFAASYGFFEITDDAALAGLSVSPGELNPLFMPGRTEYLVTVGHDVDVFSITPVASDPLAVIRINGDVVDSGAAWPVSLDIGNTYISVTVTSRDETEAKTYAILATRQGSAALSGLSVPLFELKPEFCPETAVYTLDVDQDVGFLDIVPETSDPAAGILVNGTPAGSGGAVNVFLEEGINEIEILVTAPDGSVKQYLVYARKKPAAALTVFVVDEIQGSDDFTSLNAALTYLNTTLAAGQVGHVRIQTTSPMVVDELNIEADIMITVDPGASNIVSGPANAPLVINAGGGWNISGLQFASSPAYTVNAARGITFLGTAFSADTQINIAGSAGLAAKGSAAFAKGFEFVNGSLSGFLNVSMMGDSDAAYRMVGTRAEGISFNGFGSFTGDAGLVFKSNPIPSLNIEASLKGSSKAFITGHSSLGDAGFGLEMQDSAAVFIEQNTIASLAAKFYGINAVMELKNNIIANAAVQMDMNQAQYTGNANTVTDFNIGMSYTHGLTSFGFTETGLQAHHAWVFNSGDAPSSGEITVGLNNCKFNGQVDLTVGGRGKVTLENQTVFEVEAYLIFPGSLADLQIYDVQGKATLWVKFPDSDVQAYLSAERSNMDKGMIFSPVPDNLHGSMDTITTLTGGIQIGLGGTGAPEHSEEIFMDSPDLLPKSENSLILNNLNITDEEGKPGLYVQGLNVPVIIRNSLINADLWSIVCAGIDADVTIENNSDLKGGIMLNGDPDEEGIMITRQYMVSGNTITQSQPGGACLFSHAIRNVTANANTMNAFAAGAHGVLLSGGKLQVNDGSINTLGSYFCQAIGIGPSAGGANGIVYAAGVSPISGGIVTGEKGWVKLTDNTFSNALVVDYNVGDVGRLLNDPVADNSGLNPDEHVVGSLIDWNDDEHNCPDYPTRCDEWDDDRQECGCGEDGIDPPSEPGI